ncbi:MAG: GGDEF domain-containing protein [Lachnospiraceae bacterium]|nr:GGDEF domain-containing protein [Lachnospiraceae bacterium]
MVEGKTEAIFQEVKENRDPDDPKKGASLFVCHGRAISEYSLDGVQYVGRPTEETLPDIPVFDPFVSRKHCLLETSEGKTSYTALETTNGVMYKGKLMTPGTKLELSDGDELILPSSRGKEGGTVILVYVCTESRRHLWQELMKASKDTLTGLNGRESFIIWWYQNCTRKDYAQTNLFILDVDDFKVVNDEHGHNAGDELLKLVAEELKASVRYEGQVCRWGGDEFVGVIPGTAAQAGERLTNLGRRIEGASRDADMPITVSIGFVNIKITDFVYDIVDLVAWADKALYRAKQSGKRSVEQFLPQRGTDA